MSELFENIQKLRLSDYEYGLPEERIAQFPLAQRDHSKLLVYKKGHISHRQFFEIPELLSTDDTLIFNDTKVIHARIHFHRKTGALIEVLLLHPHDPGIVAQAMQSSSKSSWQCVIGNKKRWKEDEVLEKILSIAGNECILKAQWLDKEINLVQLTWEGEHFLANVLEVSGQMPLPPYIHREADDSDSDRYQTVYAQHKGAAAAPTAGLHVTEAVLKNLQSKNIDIQYLTLHVSAGTFLPVKTEQVSEHDMHAEQFVLSQAQLKNLIPQAGKLIPVGTTSMRLLESLYWIGVNVWRKKERPFLIEAMDPYQDSEEELPSTEESLRALLACMEQKNLQEIVGETKIFIVPGFTFRLCKGLITNFHMPGTTLILLVAALLGEDWRKVYSAALDNEYRFLSYGDSSLLMP